MKADKIRAQITVDATTKAIALVISLVNTVPFTVDRERVLRTVCAHFGFRLER